MYGMYVEEEYKRSFRIINNKRPAWIFLEDAIYTHTLPLSRRPSRVFLRDPK